MKRFTRFAALLTLVAFVGLSTAETFHTHRAHQSTENCAVCQVAHRTPALLSAAASIGPHWISTPARAETALPTYVQFVLVSHGLSPPVL
jgi:hypothetical protein